jgi:hypothetical protein
VVREVFRTSDKSAGTWWWWWWWWWWWLRRGWRSAFLVSSRIVNKVLDNYGAQTKMLRASTFVFGLTPWRIVLRKVIVSQPAELPTSFLFIVSVTRASLYALSRAISVKCAPRLIPLRSIFIISSHLHQDLPSSSFLSGFPT